MRAGLLAALAAAGCNSILGIGEPSHAADGAPVLPADAAPPDAAPPADAGPDAAPDISGTIVTYLHSAGAPYEQVEFGNVAALVPRESGGFARYQANGGNGTFTILDVPTGQFYLLYGNNNFVVTSARTGLDLGADYMGRAGGVQVIDPDTRLSLDVDGLDPPWQVNDALRLYVDNSAQGKWVDSNTAENLPAEGSLALDDTSVPWTNAWLIDGGAGDRLSVLRQISSDSPGVGGIVIGQAGMADPFTMLDGAVTPVTATLVEVARDEEVTLEWRRSEWDALLADSHPAAEREGQQIVLIAQDPAIYLTRWQWSNLFDSWRNEVPATDFPAETIAYGNPFSYAEDWVVVRVAQVTFRHTFEIEGTTFTFQATSEQVVELPDDSPVAPAIGLPREPRLAGAAPFTNASEAGDYPTVSWSAPRTGEANRYHVEVWRQNVAGQDFNRQAYIVAPGGVHEIVIPDGVLVDEDAWYLVTITAIGAPGDPEIAPFRLGLPYASGLLVAGLIARGTPP